MACNEVTCSCFSLRCFRAENVAPFASARKIRHQEAQGRRREARKGLYLVSLSGILCDGLIGTVREEYRLEERDLRLLLYIWSSGSFLLSAEV